MDRFRCGRYLVCWRNCKEGGEVRDESTLIVPSGLMCDHLLFTALELRGQDVEVCGG